MDCEVGDRRYVCRRHSRHHRQWQWPQLAGNHKRERRPSETPPPVFLLFYFLYVRIVDDDSILLVDRSG